MLGRGWQKIYTSSHHSILTIAFAQTFHRSKPCNKSIWSGVGRELCMPWGSWWDDEMTIISTSTPTRDDNDPTKAVRWYHCWMVQGKGIHFIITIIHTLWTLYGRHIQPNDSSVQCIVSKPRIHYRILAKMLAYQPQCYVGETSWELQYRNTPNNSPIQRQL